MHALLSSSAINFLISKTVSFRSTLTNSAKFYKMSKFCANLSFMFTEKPFLKRYEAAKNAGFKAVESGFPFGFKLDEVVNAKKKVGIEQILINTFTGDVTKGELGFAAIPGKENEFKNGLMVAIDFAKALNVKKIHIMAGKVQEVSTAHHETYESNLGFAATILEKEGILGLIEPINNHSVPFYYLNSYERALEVLQKVNKPNIKLMLDVFHLQFIKGNITNTIKTLIPYIGHVQVAQVPHRNEPDSEGEINYKYVFKTLEQTGYTDWIGLEYKPLTTTEEGLGWIEKFDYKL